MKRIKLEFVITDNNTIAVNHETKGGFMGMGSENQVLGFKDSKEASDWLKKLLDGK